MLLLTFLTLFLLLWATFTAAAPALRQGGSFAAHRLTRLSLRWTSVQRIVTYTNQNRDYLPLVLIVIAGLALAAWAGDAFLDLAELVQGQSELLKKVDEGVHAWAVTRRSSSSTAFFHVMSTVGGPAFLTGVVALAAVALIILRRYRWAAYLVITTLGGAVIDMELKRYFARARPALAEALRHASGYAFPSGHAMGSTVVLGALSYLAFRILRRWRSKAAALAFACTFIAAVALSRIYLGVHWISDVAAGITAGVIWVATTTVAYEVVRRVRLLRVLRRGHVTRT